MNATRAGLKTSLAARYTQLRDRLAAKLGSQPPGHAERRSAVLSPFQAAGGRRPISSAPPDTTTRGVGALTQGRCG